jgi:hypothetical protein
LRSWNRNRDILKSTTVAPVLNYRSFHGRLLSFITAVETGWSLGPPLGMTVALGMTKGGGSLRGFLMKISPSGETPW